METPSVPEGVSLWGGTGDGGVSALEQQVQSLQIRQVLGRTRQRTQQHRLGLEPVPGVQLPYLPLPQTDPSRSLVSHPILDGEGCTGSRGRRVLGPVGRSPVTTLGFVGPHPYYLLQ